MIDFKKLIESKEYGFLKTNPILGDNIILLGVGGSHAYGTNVEGSDIDIRGVAKRDSFDILTGRDWEQSINNETDTVIYSLDKIIKLLMACNPNTIEMLGLRKDQYIKISEEGQLLLNNRHLFLSKRAIGSFGGYARAQLNRLCNKSGRALDESLNNEARSIQKAIIALRRDGYLSNEVRVENQKGDTHFELNGDLNLESFVKLSQVVLDVHSDYKRSFRNDHAVEHGKLAKHMMHLVRLYLMAFDILENGEIITYREKDHDLLMDIRNGKYLQDETTPTKEFMEMVEEYENHLQVAAEKTELPDRPNEYLIKKLLLNDINEWTVIRDHLKNHTPKLYDPFDSDNLKIVQ